MKTNLEKEFDRLQRNEAAYISKRQERKETKVETFINDKIPAKLESSLKKAFGKAFHVVFTKGTPLIEKTYSQDKIAEQYRQDLEALDDKGGRLDYIRFNYRGAVTGIKHTFASTSAGLALGAIGMGIPDVVVFTSFMLRNIYSIAMRYGYDYTSEDEQKFVLRIIATSMLWGEDLKRADRWLNAFITHGLDLDDKTVDELIDEVSEVLAKNLLIMKAIQGKPIIGIIGGASDFVYMERVSDYAELKYRRRFLTDREHEERYGWKR